MPDLFITGVTGLLGRALTTELVARGTRASALVRRATPDLPDTLRVVEGDLEGVAAGVAEEPRRVSLVRRGIVEARLREFEHRGLDTLSQGLRDDEGRQDLHESNRQGKVDRERPPVRARSAARGRPH